MKRGSVAFHLYFSFLLYQDQFQSFRVCVRVLAGECSGYGLCVFDFIILHHEHLNFSLCLCLCSICVCVLKTKRGSVVFRFRITSTLLVFVFLF